MAKVKNTDEVPVAPVVEVPVVPVVAKADVEAELKELQAEFKALCKHMDVTFKKDVHRVICIGKTLLTV